MQNKKQQDYKVLLTVSRTKTLKFCGKKGITNGKAVAEIPLKIKHNYFGNPSTNEKPLIGDNASETVAEKTAVWFAMEASVKQFTAREHCKTKTAGL